VIIINKDACVKHVLARGQIQEIYVQNVQCIIYMNQNFEKELDFKHTLLDFT
jgi:hypothetical protein